MKTRNLKLSCDLLVAGDDGTRECLASGSLVELDAETAARYVRKGVATYEDGGSDDAPETPSTLVPRSNRAAASSAPAGKPAKASKRGKGKAAPSLEAGA